MIKKLKQAFPISRGLKIELFALLRISLLAFVVILVLQPIGILEFNTLKILYYSLVAFFTGIFIFLVFHKVLVKFIEEEHWTVGKEILKHIVVLISIGMALLFYNSFALDKTKDLQSFLKFIGYSLLFGAFPIYIKVTSTTNWLLKKNLIESQEINKKLAIKEKSIDSIQFSICSDQTKEVVNMLSKELQYISTEGNYIFISLFRDGQESKELIRLSLKNALKQTPKDLLVQCHRYYAVNLSLVTNTVSNAQGLILITKSGAKVVVSRTFNREIKERLNSSTPIK